MDYKEIILSNGMIVKVSSCDYDYISKFHWTYGKSSQQVSVSRRVYSGGKYTSIKMSRELMRVLGDNSVVVDHINGDSLDNRRENLRICTQKENMRNQKLQEGRSSKFKGVYYSNNAKSWKVQIKDNGKMRTVTGIESEEIAGIIYDLLALDRFKEFARFNNPDLITYIKTEVVVS